MALSFSMATTYSTYLVNSLHWYQENTANLVYTLVIVMCRKLSLASDKGMQPNVFQEQPRWVSLAWLTLALQ